MLKGYRLWQKMGLNEVADKVMTNFQGLYYIYFFLIVLSKGMGFESDNIWYKVSFAIGTVLICLKLYNETYKKRKLMSMCILIAIGLMDVAFGGYTAILFTAVGIIGLKGVNTNRVIKIAFWTKTVTFIYKFIMSMIRRGPEDVLVFLRDGKEINRLTFGYQHPNMAHENLTVIIMLFLYLYHDKLRKWHYVVLMLLEYAVYKCTFLRTGIAVGILCISISILIRNRKLRKVIMKGTRHIYVLLIGCSIACPMLYGKFSVINLLDERLTGRIRAITALFETALPGAVGNARLAEQTNFDNGYITLLYLGGILAFGWFMYYLMRAYNKAFVENDYLKYALMLEFAIYYITEAFFCNIALNMALLFIGDVLFEKELCCLCTKEEYHGEDCSINI